MPVRRRALALDPFTLYVILELCSSLFFSLIFTVNMLYQVTVVQLTPLQLVLVGTILETTVFLFEIPTGVLADVKSRRLSIIIGYALIGLGFIVEGSLPFFAAVALAQVVWGFGYTFTSGATQAWIVDETGEERAGEAFLRLLTPSQTPSSQGRRRQQRPTAPKPNLVNWPGNNPPTCPGPKLPGWPMRRGVFCGTIKPVHQS